MRSRLFRRFWLLVLGLDRFIKSNFISNVNDMGRGDVYVLVLPMIWYDTTV